MNTSNDSNSRPQPGDSISRRKFLVQVGATGAFVTAAGIPLGKSFASAATLKRVHAQETAAAVLTVDNKSLSVSYDAALARFSVSIPGASPFLVNGALEGKSGEAKVMTVNDSVFGRGKSIRIVQADGSVASLEVYPQLPFLLVRKQLANTGGEVVELQNTPIAHFTLDLGKPSEALRVMGTGGLTEPDKNPGSYLFLTLADPATRKGVVAGWLTCDRGSGVLFSSVKDGKVAFDTRIDYGRLRVAPRSSTALETLVIGCFTDARLGEEQFADAIARQYRIKLPEQISGYCTWYSDQHNGAGDQKSILELANYAAHALKPFGFSFVQIDDGWQDGPIFNGPARGFDRVRPNGPYSNGMKPVAEKLCSLGLGAGIWFMPFARNYQDPEYASRQDWFVKRLNGSPYDVKWGGTSLDLTRPDVRDHLETLVRKINGWGFNYFKLDGLWTGSATELEYVNDGYKDDHIGNCQPFYDPNVTGIEMMRSGLKLIRDSVGRDVFISGCNLSQNMRSISGTIGLVNSMRIGPDNGQKWDEFIVGPKRGSRLYFLNRRVWYNDPDPNYVRASVPLEQARLIASWVGLSGQFNLNSDWIPALPPERLDILKRISPAHKTVARPVDYFDAPVPSIWLVKDDDQHPDRQVVGLFNWSSTNCVIGCEATKAGLDPAKTYEAYDFWANQPLPEFCGNFQFNIPARACRVIAIRAASGHPQVISTSRHVTQGMMDVSGEKWDARKQVLSGLSKLIASDRYELRIAGLQGGGRRWKPLAVTVSAKDAAAGVVAGLNQRGECLAVELASSAESREVRWSIQFE